jgi:hypothetical protein
MPRRASFGKSHISEIRRCYKYECLVDSYSRHGEYPMGSGVRWVLRIFGGTSTNSPWWSARIAVSRSRGRDYETAAGSDA